jgi:hypothetical protein
MPPAGALAASFQLRNGSDGHDPYVFTVLSRGKRVKQLGLAFHASDYHLRSDGNPVRLSSVHAGRAVK